MACVKIVYCSGRDQAIPELTVMYLSSVSKWGRVMRFVLKFVCICLISTSCFGADVEQITSKSILNPDNNPNFNVVFGISPFLGVLGAEYQQKKHAFGIGYPKRLSYRYYVSPYQDTKFWGMYLGKMSYDDFDDTVDGILYQNLDTEYIGVGIGYRWQWLSGWNSSVSLALHYFDYEYSNPGSPQRETEKGFFAFPGINVGYKF